MEICVQAILRAAESWALLRQLPEYDLVVGKTLFQNIFVLAPHAIELYSFERETTDQTTENDSKTQQHPCWDTIYASPAFRAHATGVVAMLGAVIGMMMPINHDENNSPTVPNDNDSETATAAATEDNVLTELAKQLGALGARHLTYGVMSAHYGIVETALLRTLQELLEENGHAWTTQVRKGWAAVFKFVACAMQTGATDEVDIVRREKESSSSSNESYWDWHESTRGESTLRLVVRQQKKGASCVARGLHPGNGHGRWSSDCSSACLRSATRSEPSLSEQHPWAMFGGTVSCSTPPKLPRRKSDPLLNTENNASIEATEPPSRQHGPPTMPRRNSDPVQWLDKVVPQIMVSDDMTESSTFDQDCCSGRDADAPSGFVSVVQV